MPNPSRLLGAKRILLTSLAAAGMGAAAAAPAGLVEPATLIVDASLPKA